MCLAQSAWCLALVVAVAAAEAGERWRWPEHTIDDKVQFLSDTEADTLHKNEIESNVQADEVPFREPTETEGFYNRPPGAGRYPVRVDPAYQVDGAGVYPVTNDRNPSATRRAGGGGAVDACACLERPDCPTETRPDRPDHLPNGCSPGKFLCCKGLGGSGAGVGVGGARRTGYFNEVQEQPFLVPGPGPGGPFPSAVNNPGSSDGHNKLPGVLVGPEGPTGNIGPPQILPSNQEVFGPGSTFSREPIVPGDVGQSASAQRGVLVGPGGPTGIIGPGYRSPFLGGPGGRIGPNRPRNGILVGPGGPSGIIGPVGYGGRRNPGVLVGPGGPTGVIGPRRPYYGK